jgi:hypothetical protein
MPDSVVGPDFFRDRSRRRCPGCGKVKRFNPAQGGRDWYMRRRPVAEFSGEGIIKDTEDVIASPYCRACTSTKNSDGRRRRKLIDRIAKAYVLTQAEPGTAPSPPCDVCGRSMAKVNVVGTSPPVFACPCCAELVGSGREKLGQMVQLLSAHMAKDQARHQLGGITDHRVCVEMHERVMQALRWMVASAGEKAGT